MTDEEFRDLTDQYDALDPDDDRSGEDEREPVYRPGVSIHAAMQGSLADANGDLI